VPSFLVIAIRGLARSIAVVVLALLAAVNLIGLLFLAYGWFMGADIHVKGGPLTVILGLAGFALCVNGVRALAHPRTPSQSSNATR
jgi:predicted tellurium resistance membrane protein TerC